VPTASVAFADARDQVVALPTGATVAPALKVTPPVSAAVCAAFTVAGSLVFEGSAGLQELENAQSLAYKLHLVEQHFFGRVLGII
jgi:hypothetical protein